MADWRDLCKRLLLADGKIDEDEVKILKKVLYADGVIDREEADFLVDLRNSAKKKTTVFTKFFFKAIATHILEDGKIDAPEARWLDKMLWADGKIDADEKKFLKGLKKDAKETDPAFEALYNKCLGG